MGYSTKGVEGYSTNGSGGAQVFFGGGFNGYWRYHPGTRSHMLTAARCLRSPPASPGDTGGGQCSLGGTTSTSTCHHQQSTSNQVLGWGGVARVCVCVCVGGGGHGQPLLNNERPPAGVLPGGGALRPLCRLCSRADARCGLNPGHTLLCPATAAAPPAWSDAGTRGEPCFAACACACACFAASHACRRPSYPCRPRSHDDARCGGAPGLPLQRKEPGGGVL